MSSNRFAIQSIKPQLGWYLPADAHARLISLRRRISWEFALNEQLKVQSCSLGFHLVYERNPRSGDQLQCFLFIFSETASCSAAWTVAQALLLVLLSFQFLDLWLMNKACPLQKLQNQVRSKADFWVNKKCPDIAVRQLSLCYVLWIS